MKRLLLIGGGHTHVEVIRRFIADPPQGARTMLVSPDRYTTYSGMLPGFIAGHYGYHDCHIDLARLCAAAGIEFVCAAATRIDADACRVGFDDGQTRETDFMSIDVGSTQPVDGIPGALEHATRVKPVPHFLAAWDGFRAAALARPAARRIVLVGGGAAGVELALAMHHRLVQDGAAAATEFHLVTDTAEILSGHPRRVRRKFQTVMRERGILTHRSTKVTRVAERRLEHERGSLEADLIVLANGAAAPGWLGDSGLALDARGFILVDETLASVSHPRVFAAGDVASMAHHPRPKSGVYAVRQGPPLAANLRQALAQRELTPYRPQQRVLALISTGDRYAVASWNGIGFSGAWVWQWKNWIDCRFMATYRIGNKSQDVAA